MPRATQLPSREEGCAPLMSDVLVWHQAGGAGKEMSVQLPFQPPLFPLPRLCCRTESRSTYPVQRSGRPSEEAGAGDGEDGGTLACPAHQPQQGAGPALHGGHYPVAGACTSGVSIPASSVCALACMLLCVCVHTHACAGIRVCVHTHTHVCIHACVCVHLCRGQRTISGFAPGCRPRGLFLASNSPSRLSCTHKL